METNHAPRSSTVDAVFDVLTAKTAAGLVAAQRALEVAARWIESRAKLAGDLAAKLAQKPA
jgi:hypothetical protein